MLISAQYVSLFKSMVRREIQAKYQGTLLGFLWNLVTPLLMLAIYATVFLAVFKAKWHMADQAQADYGLMLFIGILTHGYMAEVLTSSSNVIRNNTNLIKKVRFPVKMLPLVTIASSGVNYLLGLAMAFVYGLVQGYIHQFQGLIYLPFIIAIYVVTLTAIAYLVAALGVFLRDISQMMPVLITVLLFTSTVFFSVHSAPDMLVKIIYLNPISPVADSVRDILYGYAPDFKHMLWLLLASVLGCIFSYKLFCRLRPGFADVL
ncbi:Teichoic acid translocation permease protein TagG [Vibrio aerogenes CECT 7868]|uniref:Transport permease protein n=1 Tax=Vibrio aerogenes CECT 7868 TaxID=1216006 RepID=A0A1M5ZCQ5_9VIBR|nr:ABC transporter permease [Vibrio aerogenes]SHI21990.1 Teichoic acid translocation permease protein TagG [Vibrio aerogenes CECT 7868]